MLISVKLIKKHVSAITCTHPHIHESDLPVLFHKADRIECITLQETLFNKLKNRLRNYKNAENKRNRQRLLTDGNAADVESTHDQSDRG